MPSEGKGGKLKYQTLGLKSCAAIRSRILSRTVQTRETRSLAGVRGEGRYVNSRSNRGGKSQLWRKDLSREVSGEVASITISRGVQKDKVKKGNLENLGNLELPTLAYPTRGRAAGTKKDPNCVEVAGDEESSYWLKDFTKKRKAIKGDNAERKEALAGLETKREEISHDTTSRGAEGRNRRNRGKRSMKNGLELE